MGGHRLRFALACVAFAVADGGAIARAGGFYVPEIGARSVAMGGAMAAQDSDASTVFHNPAGLIGLGDEPEVQLASALVLPSLSYFRRPVLDPSTGEMRRFARVDNENRVAFVPYLGASLGSGIRGLELGLAVYAPFGATIEYPANGAQRQVVTGIELRTIYVSPAVAYQLPHGFRLGASVSYIYSDLSIDQANALPYVTGDPEEYPDPDPGIEGTSHIEGKDTASFGAPLGLQWAAEGGAVVAGASVMAPTTLHFEGDAVVVNEGINELLDGQGRVMQGAGRRTDTVHTSIPLPLIARAGVTWRPKPRTSIGLDVNYQRWSTFQSLVVDFQDEPELFQSPGAKLYDVTVENDWRDTWTVRLGAETRPLPWPLTMRAGALYDQSPIDDRHFGLLTPDSDKVGVSGGLAWELHGPGDHPLGLDLSYMHVFMHERDIGPGANGAPGSDGTVLNKPAPSFFHGVTRAAFDILYLAVSVRM